MSPAAVAFKLATHFTEFEEWDDAGYAETAQGPIARIGIASEQDDLDDNAESTVVARFKPAPHIGLHAHTDDGGKTGLEALRSQVATVVAGNHSAGPAWPTGVAELDQALGGGVPRGRVTEVVGAMGAGKTSLVRQLVARVLAEGGWVAWIDATRTLAPQELAGLGERLIVVRPRDHTRGAWCADLLLRSGVFSLVVLDSAPVLSRVTGVRLSQLARERDAAFVVLREGTHASRLGGAVRLQVQTSQPKIAYARISLAQTSSSVSRTLGLPQRASMMQRPSVEMPVVRNDLQRNYSVLVEKGGTYRTVEVNCAVIMARRVCADSEIPDRRGVARRTRTAADSLEQPEQQHAGNQELATVTAAGRDLLQHFTRKGRGRARAAESGYGNFTRRGEARRLLHLREQQSRQHAQPQFSGPARQSLTATVRHVTQQFQPCDIPYPRKERQYQR
jgi:hypothetical protein